MRKLWMLCALSAIVLGCSDGTGPNATPEGTYVLSTINGGVLPVVVLQAGSDRLEVTAGQVRINRDGTGSDSYSFRLTQAGGITLYTENDVGTWTLQGNNLRIAWASGSVETFAWGGDSLTMTDQGMTMVYQR